MQSSASLVGKCDCAEQQGLVCIQRPVVRFSNRQVKDRRRVVYRESKVHDATGECTSQWVTRTSILVHLIPSKQLTQRHSSVRIDNGLKPKLSVLWVVIRRWIGRKPKNLGSKLHVQVIPVQSPEDSR